MEDSFWEGMLRSLSMLCALDWVGLLLGSLLYVSSFHSSWWKMVFAVCSKTCYVCLEYGTIFSTSRGGAYTHKLHLLYDSKEEGQFGHAYSPALLSSRIHSSLDLLDIMNIIK